MEKLIESFPTQIEGALQIAKDSQLTFFEGKTFDNVVICGMGGSGIGGKMVSQLFANQSKTPILLVQDYELPAFANKNSLVIVSSYSGNTEETLEALHQAIERGATIVGVSSGGKLEEICKENKFDFIELPGGNPPRSMLIYSAVQLIHILAKAGIVESDAIDLLKNSHLLLLENMDDIKELAHQLAQHIYQKHCVFYADTPLEFVAIRARQQVNENGKQLCWHHVIPEMNHNELVGWGGGNDSHAVVFFVSQFLSERNKLRINLCEEIIKKKTKNVLSIHGKGENLMEEAIYFIHIIDWSSVYLAELNQQDPMEVHVIDYLKGKLGK